MPDSNIPVVDLAGALAPDRLAAWLEYEYAGHAANSATLLARHAKFLAVTTNGIGDDVMAGHATDFANELKDEVTATDATRTRIKAPVLHAQRLIDGEAKKLTDNMTAAKKIVLDRITDYLRVKDFAARKAAQEEAARLAAEADAKIAAAHQSGDAETQEAAIEAIGAAQQAEQIAIAAPIELTRTRSQMGGLVGLKSNWTYRVVDLSKVPEAYKTLNDTVIKAAIKTGVRDIPGLEIFDDAKAMIR